MWSQVVSVVIISVCTFAADRSKDVIPGLQTIKFWNRADGDHLAYIRTRITVPTPEFQLHELRFPWEDPTQNLTQLTVDCNGRCSVMVFGSSIEPPITVYVTARESKQLISTVRVYALAVETD